MDMDKKNTGKFIKPQYRVCLVLAVTFLLLSSCQARKKILISDPTAIEILIRNHSAEPLPFTLVYGGAKIRNTEKLLAKGGFSHIALGSSTGDKRKSIPAANRAILWTGISKGDRNAPWAVSESPWGNNLERYRASWGRRLKSYAENYGESSPAPQADFIVLDIEAELHGSKIDALLKEETVPANYKRLDVGDFRKEYKKEMKKLSAEPVVFLKSQVGSTTTKFASYGDAPIPRDWFGIPKHSWKDWQESPKKVNYLGEEGPSVVNPFTDELNVLTPSAYFFYPRGQNLAYLLFQIEVNRSRSNKDMVLFVTPRLVAKKYYGQPISEELAETTAIFPFFSGATGLWLWEGSRNREKEDLAIVPAYRGFFRGLRRLGEYGDFFIGDYKLIIPQTAHQLFIDKAPVWRAVEKDGKLLVAAVNPYASVNEQSNLRIKHGRFETTLHLVGQNCLLEVFDMENAE